jgi:hypothetical protein
LKGSQRHGFAAEKRLATEASFAVGGQGRCHFDGDTFVYEDNQSPRLSAIRGDPVKQLLRINRRS